MRDSTGINWLSHFLHGTCTILRLQHPESLASTSAHNSQRRAFFLTTRIFEIARSLIYTEQTFLSEPAWAAALVGFWQNEGAESWHPKEALFDVLPGFSSLGVRTVAFCEDIEQFTIEVQCHLIQSLADEGLLLQESLEQWRVGTAAWKTNSQDPGPGSTMPNLPDTELLIGYVYYHAASIYLSGSFDYYEHWTWPGAPATPILPRSQIDWHVSEILRISEELLAQGISGVLLFFALRVAGARAIDLASRDMILDLLRTTVKRGFIVAEAFTVDLSELWASQD
jgi:hypothetical protein